MATVLPPVAAGLVAAAAVWAGVALGRRIEDAAVPAGVGAAAAALAGGAVVLLSQGPLPLSFVAWSAILLAGLAALAVTDGATRTVPDALTLPMIALGLLHAAIGPASFAPAGAAVVLVIGGGWLADRLLPGQLSRWAGDGDLLLLAGALAWLGPATLPDLALVTGILLAAQATLARIRVARASGARDHGRLLPLAPALGTAQAILWFGGPVL
jgi:prepilin signal peptidase PulO-like enzyme (type II secretory pathway)